MGNEQSKLSGQQVQQAAQNGDEPAIVQWLRGGGDPNAPLSQWDPPDQWRAVHWAVAFGHLGIARALVRAGANVHMRVRGGETIAHAAARDKGMSGGTLPFVVEELRADVNALCKDGATPLMHALLHHYEEAVQYLLAAGSDVTVKGTSGVFRGHTAWTLAWQERNKRMMAMLDAVPLARSSAPAAAPSPDYSNIARLRPPPDNRSYEAPWAAEARREKEKKAAEAEAVAGRGAAREEAIYAEESSKHLRVAAEAPASQSTASPYSHATLLAQAPASQSTASPYSHATLLAQSPATSPSRVPPAAYDQSAGPAHPDSVAPTAQQNIACEQYQSGFISPTAPPVPPSAPPADVLPMAVSGVQPSALHEPVPAAAASQAREESAAEGETDAFLSGVTMAGGGVIAEGNFGMVMKGRYSGDPVAIKVLKMPEGADEAIRGRYKRELLNEMKTLSRVRHNRVVSLLGLFEHPLHGLCLVMEWVEGGTLLHFVREQADVELDGRESVLSEQLRRKLALDVAYAMNRLSELRVFHCDLACRNVLLRTSPAGASPTAIVADFGLSKIAQSEQYSAMYATGKQTLPVAWSAPEVIMRRKFSSKADVWSYGCVLWEIWSGGATLYAGMSMRQVCREVTRRDGIRLPRPEECEDAVWALISRCWAYAPKDRPSFADICHELEGMQL